MLLINRILFTMMIVGFFGLAVQEGSCLRLRVVYLLLTVVNALFFLPKVTG